MKNLTPIRHRIKKINVFLALISFIVVIVFISYLEITDYRQSYSRDLIAHAGSVRAFINSYLTQSDDLIKVVLKKVKTFKDEKKILAYLENNLFFSDPVNQFFVLDKKNRIILISSRHKDFLGIDFSHFKYVRSEKRVSFVHQSLFTRESVVTFKYSLNNDLTLYVERNLKSIIPIIKYMHDAYKSRSIELFILTEKGTVVYHENLELMQSRHNLLHDFQNIQPTSKQGIFSFNHIHEHYLAYREKIGIPVGWVVYSRVSNLVFRKALIKSISIQSAIVAFILILYYSLFSFLVNKYLTNPLQKISNILNVYKPGQKDLVLSEENAMGSSELYEIIKSINFINKSFNESNQELGKSELLFRTLSDFESNWVFWLDQNNEIKFMSEICEAITGYSKEEFHERPELIEDIILEMDKNIWKNHGHSLDRNMMPEPIEFRIITKDKKIKWISHVCRKIYDEEGRFLGLRASNRDISERKIYQQSIEQSEKKFKELFNSIMDIISISNNNGELLGINRAFLQNLGFSQDSIRELRVSNYQKDLDPDFFQWSWDHILSGNDLAYETSYTTSLGDKIPVEIHARLINYDNQSAMIQVARDITERKKAQDELYETKNFLDNIINSMPSLIIAINQDLNIIQCNEAAVKFSGSMSEKMRGNHYKIFFPDFVGFSDKILECVYRKRIVNLEKFSLVKEKGIRHYNIFLYPMELKNATGAVIKVDDITEHFKMEQLMIQSEKMMSIGGLAAGMAHEINNPLGIILQGVNNTFRRLSSDLKKNHEVAENLGLNLMQMQRYIEERGIQSYLIGIKEAGIRAADIVTNMLRFSRSNNVGKNKVNLNLVLDDAIKLAQNDYDLRSDYDFKHVEIVKNYDLQLPEINCNRSEIEQVILNLLKNAAHALFEKNIEKKSRIVIDSFQDEDYLGFRVSDNGIGMDKHTRQKVFEPFFTTKEPDLGTGLGLSVSYFIIIKNHSGLFFVESELNRGSVFTVKLPL